MVSMMNINTRRGNKLVRDKHRGTGHRHNHEQRPVARNLLHMKEEASAVDQEAPCEVVAEEHCGAKEGIVAYNVSHCKAT